MREEKREREVIQWILWLLMSVQVGLHGNKIASRDIYFQKIGFCTSSSIISIR